MTQTELTVHKGGGLAMPKSYTEVFELAAKVAGSQLVPKNFQNKPQDIAVAMMMASENGVSPIQALSFIAVINGKPGWHSDAVPGIAKAKGLIKGYQEKFEGVFPDDDFKAVCVVTASDGSTYTNEFSVAEAKKASLWNKAGPWSQYPRRMLQWRARSWAIRDAAPDAFFGPTAEELRDANAQYRGPDRAKEISVDTSAPPREIVTMTLDSPAFHDEVAEQSEGNAEPDDAVREVEPDQIDPPVQKPKTNGIQAKLMELADADTMEAVVTIEDQMDKHRASLKPKQIEVLNRAIREAKSRLNGDDQLSAADRYMEMITAGETDLDEIAARLDADNTLSDGDVQALFTALDNKRSLALP
jgi:hypothetical protein